jgi:hypothetical protein
LVPNRCHGTAAVNYFNGPSSALAFDGASLPTIDIEEVKQSGRAKKSVIANTGPASVLRHVIELRMYRGYLL